MAQKVHPLGFRLGHTMDWQSHWYAGKFEYMTNLNEDIRIRKFLFSRLKNADVDRIIIDRAGGRVSIVIHTAKPGVIIGRKGLEVERLKKALSKFVDNQNIGISIEEVKVAELSARIVAEQIAWWLQRRTSHRRAMKRAIDTAIRLGAKGVKIRCKGRLGGREIARKEGYLRGRVPLHTMNANIDFAVATSFTKHGTIGVKVWMYKGNIPKLSERAKTHQAGGK